MTHRVASQQNLNLVSIDAQVHKQELFAARYKIDLKKQKNIFEQFRRHFCLPKQNICLLDKHCMGGQMRIHFGTTRAQQIFPLSPQAFILHIKLYTSGNFVKGRILRLINTVQEFVI